MNRRIGGPQSRSGRFAEAKNLNNNSSVFHGDSKNEIMNLNVVVDCQRNDMLAH
jgi:hypothetical protein